jgi:hypothetical protein
MSSSDSPEPISPSFGPGTRHVLVLDISRSMLAPLPAPGKVEGDRKKIEVARAATFRIFDTVVSQGASFGLVVFNSVARVAIPLAPIRPESRPILDNLIALLEPAGKSAIWDALALAADLLRVEGGRVVGNMVLVTDGWDNMSQLYHAEGIESPAPGTGSRPQDGTGRRDILPYLLPPGSQLSLQIIGIGSGSEKDKGVDSSRMRLFERRFRHRSQEEAPLSSISYQEVTNSVDLFSQMVHAFVDVPFEDAFTVDTLRPDEVAQRAATAARALREPEAHSLVHHLAASHGRPPPPRSPYVPPARPLTVDVLSGHGTSGPVHLKDRYGPVGEVAEAFLARDWPRAQAVLYEKGAQIPAVTRFYWQARLSWAQGQKKEALQFLTQAWAEAEKLSSPERRKIYRRLGLLQARIDGDRETETLVSFFDAAESRAQRLSPEVREGLEAMFDKILELRRTYAGVRGGAAWEHESLVEEIFSLVQDLRLQNVQRDPAIDGFLDFVEIALSEMR